VAPLSKSANSSYERRLPHKVEVDEFECFETSNDVAQTLICDFGAAVSKSTSLSDKSHLLSKVEVNGF